MAASFEDVEQITGDWPGVAPGTFYGTSGMKVSGKGFCRMWSQREHDRDGVHDTEVLVVFCDLDEKPALLLGESEGRHGLLGGLPHV